MHIPCDPGTARRGASPAPGAQQGCDYTGLISQDAFAECDFSRLKV